MGLITTLKNHPSIRKWCYGRYYGKKYADMAMFRAIDGWLHDAEANRLFDIAGSLPDDGPVVVELGSWLGKSSVVLSQALAEKERASSLSDLGFRQR